MFLINVDLVLYWLASEALPEMLWLGTEGEYLFTAISRNAIRICHGAMSITVSLSRRLFDVYRLICGFVTSARTAGGVVKMPYMLTTFPKHSHKPSSALTEI